ncbi:unnamed protein product [Mycena citricolor]|uniref:Uncharacterized protein n=1 Tax=Mycena citricolor TaxID=2018698 RepID=A0AAD2Q0Q5_9AGAR|nr:unnamed protein product [Mycena citricolor]
MLMSEAVTDLTIYTAETGVSLFLYGIYLCLAILTLYVYARAGSRRSPSAKRLVYIVLPAGLVLGTTQTVLDVVRMAVVWVTLLSPEGVTPGRAYEAYIASNIASNVFLCVNVLVTDIFLMYRCFVVWERNRAVLIAPVLLILATTATALVAAIQAQNSSMSASAHALSAIVPALLGTVTNICLTCLTAYKIWSAHRVAVVFKTNTGVRTRYRKALLIITESGAIYTICTVGMAIGLLVQPNTAGVTYLVSTGVVKHMLNIVPALALLYTGLQETSEAEAGPRLPLLEAGDREVCPAPAGTGPRSEFESSPTITSCSLRASTSTAMALLSFIYNRPNRVLQLQKQYQADPRPIFLRPAGAKATLTVYGTLFSLGFASSLYGAGCLVTGYGKGGPSSE